MKIGIVVDGDAESQALKLLTRRLQIPDIEILDPIFASMQPKSSPEQIARAAKTAISMLQRRGVELIIVLIDREDRDECCGQWAAALENAFQYLNSVAVRVAVKNRKLENWLIADPSAFERQRARYVLNRRFYNAVISNKADNVTDAEKLITALLAVKSNITNDGMHLK